MVPSLSYMPINSKKSFYFFYSPVKNALISFSLDGTFDLWPNITREARLTDKVQSFHLPTFVSENLMTQGLRWT